MGLSEDLFSLFKEAPVELKPIGPWLVKPSSSRTEPIMPDDILNLKIDLGRTQDVNEFLEVI